MKIDRILGLAAAGCLAASVAQAQISDDVVKIGVLSDMSSLYSDIGGPGSVIAARMAVADFGGKVAGKPIEVISADGIDTAYERVLASDVRYRFVIDAATM